MSLVLTSPDFENRGEIPRRFTGEGENISPTLEWSGVPEGTREFVLICEDPDAPGPEPFVHWMLYNISGNLTFLPPGISSEARLEAPIQADQGVNSAGEVGYTGPMPPKGTGVHHYIFKLYALEAEVGLRPGIEDKKELLDAIKGHIIGGTQFVGTYVRGSKNRQAA
jgi:Raf kinase inhibitor-like YbhB/YbcL family protein